ncbi:uncharacterized protein KGF55_003666 [Candida pseudojiufengensis]|uniref:uncharacterized protein n=1 Tax=Candida pseudojiufengensis TaxID=497109 RepID=UPI0022246ABE|nr:uncharacterized protein KGF55_003666 [Candida pseudojiufengensis]KAI5962590.1 hypothetical protein KGF55_003666 [Candida pseudojiufengensis]
MNISVTFPESHQHKYRVKSSIQPQFKDGRDEISKEELDVSQVAVPVINYDNQQFVLIKDVSRLWNFTSSYQLILALTKNGVKINEIEKTDKDINKELYALDVIDETELSTKLFYIALNKLASVLENNNCLYSNNSQNDSNKHLNEEKENNDTRNPKVTEEDKENDLIIEDEEEDEVDESEDNDDDGDSESDDDIYEEEKGQDPLKKGKTHHIHKHKFDMKYLGDDKVTISQVFPQYGIVESTIQLNHGSFGSLNPSTKLNFYKQIPNHAGFKFLPNTKLNFDERELIMNTNNISNIQMNDDLTDSDKKRNFRRPLGKNKKNNIHIDPNAIDLSESVIPGQGYIPEFNINHLCKVPNYYVTSNHQSTQQSFNTKRLNTTSNSSFLFNDGIKMSKNIQQLVFSNDSDNYHHSKYYYTKGYRGPGSGNYKDGALMNKINKIHTTQDKRKFHKRKISNKDRYNKSLKGLLHDTFNENFVESLLAEQRKYTEDYSNLEMLHNNLQYNLLLNSYRSISEDTWNCYFKFKSFDFEQYNAIKTEKNENEIKKKAIEDHRKWTENEKLREERLRMVFDDERKAFEELQQKFMTKQKELEERKRRQQLELSFDDSFDGNNEENDKNEDFDNLRISFEKERLNIEKEFGVKKKSFMTQIAPPAPIETPQSNIISRFTSPAAYPDIARHLPIDLRSTGDTNKDEIPFIKNPIQCVSTNPTSGNEEFLTKYEIVKIPNANSFGWDNIKKYKEN